MKILLVNPKTSLVARAPSCPLGLLSIASFLNTKGYEVKIVDQTVKKENIEKQIKLFDPDVVGVSFISAMASEAAIKVSKIAKKHNKTVVWGGQIISALPELGFKEGCVDFIVIGEGEITFLDLLKTIEKGGSFADVEGLAFMDNCEMRINKQREFADLAEFPILDWSLVDAKRYFQTFFMGKKMLYLYASKGCPGACTFCFNQKFHRRVQRRRPIEQVVDEIEYLIKSIGVDSVNFADEFWFPGREDMQEFFRLIKERNLDFVWGIQTRLGVFTREDLQQMYDAGCRWILFGVESGCESRIRSIKKGIDIGKAKETFQNCREIGITSQSAFIIGYPDETEEELKQTIKFAFELEANLCPFTILYPQPGSEIFESAVRGGKCKQPASLKERGLQCSGDTVIFNLSKVPSKELKVIHFYTQWAAFVDKGAVNFNSFGIAKKMVSDTFKKIFRFGVVDFFTGAFVSLKQFLTVFYYAKAYPEILEKYGINKRKTK